MHKVLSTISDLQKIHSYRMKSKEILNLLKLIGFKYSLGLNTSDYDLDCYKVIHIFNNNYFYFTNTEKIWESYTAYSEYDYKELYDFLVVKFKEKLRKHKIQNILSI